MKINHLHSYFKLYLQLLTCLLTFPLNLTQALSLHLWAKGSGTEQQVRTPAGAGEEEEGAE